MRRRPDCQMYKEKVKATGLLVARWLRCVVFLFLLAYIIARVYTRILSHLLLFSLFGFSFRFQQLGHQHTRSAQVCIRIQQMILVQPCQL